MFILRLISSRMLLVFVTVTPRYLNFPTFSNDKFPVAIFWFCITFWWRDAIILPAVLYGYETWSLTLGQEQRLRVFEDKVLSKIFGTKREGITGEWRKLHTFYSLPNIIWNIKSRRVRWAGHVTRMVLSRNKYRIFVGKSEWKRHLGRPRRRWEDNIKMDLRAMGCVAGDWIELAQDRDQWRAYVWNLRVP